MKKRYALLILLIPLLTLFVLGRNNSKSLRQEEPKSPISGEFRDFTDISFKDKTIRAAWVKLPNLLVTLNPNFAEKQNSKQLYLDKNCDSLVSGGFYTREDSPTGLFVSQGKKLAVGRENLFLNGVFYLNNTGKFGIGAFDINDDFKFAIQTGPVLIRTQRQEVLKIINDEKARRVVVGVSSNNIVYFIIFYDPASVFSGPFLQDLPQIMNEFSKKNGIQWADVINLDGGSASAFITKNFELPEITFIGSFFCIKNETN